jgi:hypothetical protein
MRAKRTQTIKFLTLDESKRLFAVIKDWRDKAIFLIAYRHGLRASEVELFQTGDLGSKKLSTSTLSHDAGMTPDNSPSVTTPMIESAPPATPSPDDAPNRL